jgi:hypothetical protein
MTLGTAATQRRVAAMRTHGPLVWQRTGTIGTELVLRDGAAPGVVTGTAVVGGPLPYTSRWHADLDGDWRVRSLTITTEGSGWRRNLALSRAGDTWTCGAEETGSLSKPGLSVGGTLSLPKPGLSVGGVDDTPAGAASSARLDPAAVVLLADSPMFLTWAMRALRLEPASAPVTTPVIRVRMPWLTVLPGESTLHRVSDHRLRISGDGPAHNYDLDDEGIVTYHPGRLRIAP